MRKRVLLVAGLLLGLAGVVGVALWWATPRARINGKSSIAIGHGMTIEQVESILGVPPGNYSSRKNFRLELGELKTPEEISRSRIPDETERAKWKVWVEDTEFIMVRFDDKGLVDGIWYKGISYGGEVFFDKLRRWLHL